MNLNLLIKELRHLLETIESNLKICQNFYEIKQQINVILQKFENLDNGQTNKIIFIGRQGSRKTEILTYLSKCLPSVYVTTYKCDKNAFVNNGYEDTVEYSKFETENAVICTKFMDTPFYNYSDELDNDILNNCWDANIFVVVTNAVGSIGDQDKNFLKKIATKVFVVKLIFIFTGMEKVSDKDKHGVIKQHESNAIKIANEILNVPQKNIPVFFTNDDQLDAEKFLSTCIYEISLEGLNAFADCIHSCHEELKEIIEEIRYNKQSTQKILPEDNFPDGKQDAGDYLQVILDLYIKAIIDDLLKYENIENSIIPKESLITNLMKYWPDSIDYINADFLKTSDAELNRLVLIIFNYYINKQFKSTNQFSRNIRDNIVEIFLEVNHIFKMNFYDYFNSDNVQTLICKCESLIDFLYRTEDLLLIKEILCFLIFIELILTLKYIENVNNSYFYYYIYQMYYTIRCKESQFSKNMQLLEFIFVKIKNSIRGIIEKYINNNELKESKHIIVENVESSSFIQFVDSLNLVKVVNRTQNLIKQHVNIFNLDKSDVCCQFAGNFVDIVSDTNNGIINN